MLSSLDAADSHFLALAPHTTAAVNDALQELGRPRTAQLFVPVFPVDTGAPAAASRQGFVLQGLLEAHRWLTFIDTSCPDIEICLSWGRPRVCCATVRACRRNYTAIFEGIQRTSALMQSQGVVLTLIGHGDLHIPDALHGKVVKRTSLDYKVRSSIMPGFGCKQKLYAREQKDNTYFHAILPECA